MPSHRIVQGETLSSLGVRYGVPWRRIWNHAKNEKLREQRKDPDILHPGDVVFVPDKRRRIEQGETGRFHRFVLKQPRARLHLRVVEGPFEEAPEAPPEEIDESGRSVVSEDPKPGRQKMRVRKQVAYLLDVEGTITEGRTSTEGMIECDIAADAAAGKLVLEPGTPDERTFTLLLGHLNPFTEVSGVKQRLANLDFYRGDIDEEPDDDLAVGVRLFQEAHGLSPTGKLDDALRAKLREAHGDDP